MLSRNIRHIPVHDGKGLIGMVSIRDVLKVRLDELQQETAQLRSIASWGVEPQDR
jgi:CBS domain-containing protein